MPTVVRKNLDNTSAILTVTVTRDEIKPKLDSELKRFRQRAAIKGFRQGQAPMEFIKRMYGTALFADTINDMFSQSIYDYIRDNNINVLGQPLPTEDQQKFSFKISNPEPEYVVNYEIGFVNPIEIQGLDKSQTYDRYVISNLDELAEEDLTYARRRMGQRSNPEDDIQENDIVRIAARELDGDAVKEGGWETTMSFLIKTLADETLKAELLTKKKGDVVRFNARTIENHEQDSMYRKYILNLEENDDRTVGDFFEGTIEEVSRVSDAEFDQEFFNNYFGGGVSNKEEAMEQLRKGITQFYDVRSDALLMRDFQERMLELNPIELPDTFLRKWLNVSNEGKLSAESIEREYPAFAQNLRWSMLRDKIKDDFGIEVTDEDVRQEYVARVRNYFQVDLPENVLDGSVERLMQDAKDVEKTKENLESDKVFSAIRSQVTLVDKPISSEDFHKILDSVSKKAQQEQSEDATLRGAVEVE